MCLVAAPMAIKSIQYLGHHQILFRYFGFMQLFPLPPIPVMGLVRPERTFSPEGFTFNVSIKSKVSLKSWGESVF